MIKAIVKQAVLFYIFCNIIKFRLLRLNKVFIVKYTV